MSLKRRGQWVREKTEKQKCYYITKRGACFKKAELIDYIKCAEKTNMRIQVSISFTYEDVVGDFYSVAFNGMAGEEIRL